MKSNPSVQSTKIAKLLFSDTGEGLPNLTEAILRGEETTLRSLPVKWDKNEDVLATAFDLLMRQPPAFHEKQTPLYEQLFEEAFTAGTPDSKGLLADIMAIVALHRTGLSVPFIEKKIRESQGNPSMELHLLLLEIKIKEDQPGFNPDAWGSIDPEKPHFVIANIYVYMRSQPRVALDFVWEKGRNERFDLSESLKNFAAGYVAVAIYHYFLLTPGYEEEFMRNYLAVRSPWVKAVLNESFDRPALRAIWDGKLEPIRQKLVKLEIENQDAHKQEGGEPGAPAILTDESNQKITSVVESLTKLSLQLDSLSEEEYEALQELPLPEKISNLLSRPVPSAASDTEQPANTSGNYKIGVTQSAELISHVRNLGPDILHTEQYAELMNRTETKYDFQNHTLETKKERSISFSSEQKIFDSIKEKMNPDMYNSIKEFFAF